MNRSKTSFNVKFLLHFGAVFALIPVGEALAQAHCNAYFPFDGNLQDVGGNGYHGTMIGTGGGAGKVSYGEGRFGQALKLDGTSAMRALMDLHYESCPKVTITAWVKHTGAAPKGTQSLISTGSGSGPGLRLANSTLVMNGTGNGIPRRDTIRQNGGWTFVAGVYDYEKREYTLHVRNRSETREMGGTLYTPEDSLWVGAFNDKGSYPLKDVLIDDLRVYGRALSPDEISAISSGTQAAVGANSCAFPDVCKAPINPSIAAQPMPGADPNFARAGSTLPGSDPNFARAGATLPDGGADFARSDAIQSTPEPVLQADDVEELKNAVDGPAVEETLKPASPERQD